MGIFQEIISEVAYTTGQMVGESRMIKDSKKQLQYWNDHKSKIYSKWVTECKKQIELEKMGYFHKKEFEADFQRLFTGLNTSGYKDYGNRYFRGDGVRKNLSLALDYYIAATWEGDIGAAAGGAGRVLLEMKQSDRASVYLYYGAVNGDRNGNYGLSKVFLDNGYPLHNPAIAHDFSIAAADQGNVVAMCNVGFDFNTGRGVELNVVKAHYWYKKGAELGDTNCQYNLGCLYSGTVTATYNNANMAGYWFNEAAKKGDVSAAENLKSYRYSRLTKRWSKIT